MPPEELDFWATTFVAFHAQMVPEVRRLLAIAMLLPARSDEIRIGVVTQRYLIYKIISANE